jgi:undecaprenyl-diphosphatase
VNRSLWWGVALVLAAVVLGFATGSLTGLDKVAFKALAMTHRHTADWAISVAQFVTRLGDPGTRSLFIILLLCAVIYRRSWRAATVFLVTVALSITVHSVMKVAFGRTRPGLVPWLDNADTYAYPSGHAAGVMVVLLMGALLLGGRQSVIVALLVAVAIGLSRIALGVHWPSDVIGGWTYGGGMAMIGYAVAQQVERPQSKRAS